MEDIFAEVKRRPLAMMNGADMGSKHDIASGELGLEDEDEIPTGVKMLITSVKPELQPFALEAAREHYAMLKLFKDIRTLLKLIVFLLKTMPVVSAGIAAVVGAVWWAYLHLEIHR